MPDIDPAALLSRPAISTTPILPPKTLSAPIVPKVVKVNHVPPRIDLEPLYASLKAAIGSENWKIYTKAFGAFMIGVHIYLSTP